MKNKSMRNEIFEYAKKKYKTSPEYLWKSAPSFAVLRHSDNRKWYAIVMNVDRSKFSLTGSGEVDVINVKTGNPFFTESLVSQNGFYPGYHMSHGNWVTILLDGTVPLKDVTDLIDVSFNVTSPGIRRKKERAPKEWLIPANPKYYDIEHAFDFTDEIDWKQGRSINSGDTVFVYAGAPVSAILFKCKVTKTDIPCDYEDGNLSIKSLMKLKLLRRYKPSSFTFKKLNDEYGIYAVRGPRGIPFSLSEALKNSSK